MGERARANASDNMATVGPWRVDGLYDVPVNLNLTEEFETCGDLGVGRLAGHELDHGNRWVGANLNLCGKALRLAQPRFSYARSDLSRFQPI